MPFPLTRPKPMTVMGMDLAIISEGLELTNSQTMKLSGLTLTGMATAITQKVPRPTRSSPTQHSGLILTVMDTEITRQDAKQMPFPMTQHNGLIKTEMDTVTTKVATIPTHTCLTLTMTGITILSIHYQNLPAQAISTTMVFQTRTIYSPKIIVNGRTLMGTAKETMPIPTMITMVGQTPMKFARALTLFPAAVNPLTPLKL